LVLAAVTEGGRYRKRAATMSAAVTRSQKRPLQEAGGGDGCGRYINNALRQDASAPGKKPCRK
jgi:hypothetical protein